LGPTRRALDEALNTGRPAVSPAVGLGRATLGRAALGRAALKQCGKTVNEKMPGGRRSVPLSAPTRRTPRRAQSDLTPLSRNAFAIKVKGCVASVCGDQIVSARRGAAHRVNEPFGQGSGELEKATHFVNVFSPCFVSRTALICN